MKERPPFPVGAGIDDGDSTSARDCSTKLYNEHDLLSSHSSTPSPIHTHTAPSENDKKTATTGKGMMHTLTEKCN